MTTSTAIEPKIESLLSAPGMSRMEYDINSEHREGIMWHEAVLPFRLHRCRAQSSGWVNDYLVDRCSCGALRVDLQHWNFKNERRRKTPSF